MLDVGQLDEDTYIVTFNANECVPMMLDVRLAYYLFGTTNFGRIRDELLKIKASPDYHNYLKEINEA